MTNNNWIEELKTIFDSFRETGWALPKNREEKLESFISNLLTKKDQEHKAELEMIREEVISNQQTNLKTESDPDWFQGYGYNLGLQSVTIILDKHINK